jgi:hypothetical protein
VRRGVEAEADLDHLRTPRRISATSAAGPNFASPAGPHSASAAPYEIPRALSLNNWALVGEWTVGRENVVLALAGGSIAFRFHARDAHLVLTSGARESVPFRVLLDRAAPGSSHGVDVDENGSGLLQDGRLYQLIRQDGAVRKRILEITFLEPAAETYVFTFG